MVDVYALLFALSSTLIEILAHIWTHVLLQNVTNLYIKETMGVLEPKRIGDTLSYLHAEGWAR